MRFVLVNIVIFSDVHGKKLCNRSVQCKLTVLYIIILPVNICIDCSRVLFWHRTISPRGLNDIASPVRFIHYKCIKSTFLLIYFTFIRCLNEQSV